MQNDNEAKMPDFDALLNDVLREDNALGAAPAGVEQRMAARIAQESQPAIWSSRPFAFAEMSRQNAARPHCGPSWRTCGDYWDHCDLDCGEGSDCGAGEERDDGAAGASSTAGGSERDQDWGRRRTA